MTDAVIGGDPARVFVLDRHLSRISVFDTTGAHLLSFGRAGEGPGELYFPSAIATSDDTLFVADATASIKRFRIAQGEALYLDQIRMEKGVSDFCLMDDAIVVIGPNQPVISVSDLAGKRIRSFGNFYRTDNPLVEMAITEGALACDPDRGVIYAALQLIPEVRAYELSGELRWALRLDDIQMESMQETARGLRHGFVNGHEYYQLIWGLSLVGDHHLGLQIAKRLEEGDPGVPFHELDLMVIDLFDPGDAAIRTASPEIVGRWNDHLLSLTRIPFPQIEFLSMASSSSFPN